MENHELLKAIEERIEQSENRLAERIHDTETRILGEFYKCPA